MKKKARVSCQGCRRGRRFQRYRCRADCYGRRFRCKGCLPTEAVEGNRTPVVRNVQAAQIEGTKLLRITYDLKVADDFPCNITIRWSTDNGASFPCTVTILTATAVTGAVGPGVMQGENLEVIWDMAVDWDNKFTDEGQVEIIANRIPASGGDGLR